MKLSFASSCVVLLAATSALAAEAPKPYGPVPSPRQLRWHDLEVYGFLHFGPNTFTDKEWGYGDESEKMFNPTDFNADQIARTAKEAGMRGLVLTCKHHDGFCLWPSKYTEHSVKNSPWRGGQGDVVKEISEACRRHGLKFGVYLSPWDRNHKDYGTPRYVAYYRNQLRELLTEYGPIFEVWFDGANGGDGYYGGAWTTRRIDNRTYYDWQNTWKIVRRLQPEACMFSDGGPDCRWVGNESGFAGETCWATIDRKNSLPGLADAAVLNVGQRHGADWLPAEVDVSIRPGWFYHPAQDKAVKSVAQLLKIYYESVGRGCNLVLNIPPDRRGQIHGTDVKALRQWRQILGATFATDLARGAKATASNSRGNAPQFAAANVVDGKRDTYWATDDDVTTADLVLDLGIRVTFNVVRLREYLPLGQRVDSVAMDSWDGHSWKQFATATSIGNQRLLRTPSITTTKVRLRVTKAAACPAISEVGLFLAPQSGGPCVPTQSVGTRRTRRRADWLHQARWGVMTHYLGAPPSSAGGAELTAEMWNKQVDAFDVAGLADQVASTGAQYLLFTIGQNSGHYCAPNATYDKIVGIRPSKCSRRDLVSDVAKALKAKNIRLMVYLPSGAPAADVVARKRLGWRWGAKGGWQLPGEPVGGRLAKFQRNWEAVIRDWSLRWGKQVSGWWIDGCYFADQMYRFDDAPNFASFAAALRAGHPDAIVAFNPGVRIPVIAHSKYEDYSAGEVNLDQLPRAAATCRGRWLDCEGTKVQFHILTYLGTSWCRGDRPQWPDAKVVGCAKEIIDRGGVVTFDVPIQKSGLIPQPFVEQLRAIGRAMKCVK